MQKGGGASAFPPFCVQRRGLVARRPRCFRACATAGQLRPWSQYHPYLSKKTRWLVDLPSTRSTTLRSTCTDVPGPHFLMGSSSLMSILTTGAVRESFPGFRGVPGVERLRAATGFVFFAGFFGVTVRAVFLTDLLGVFPLRTLRFVAARLTFATLSPTLCNGRHLLSVTVRRANLDRTVTYVNGRIGWGRHVSWYG